MSISYSTVKECKNYLRKVEGGSSDADKSNGEKITAIIKNLVGRGQSKPRKLKTLANTINSLFTNKLEESELMSLIKMLQERKYIIVNQGNVSYKLPKLP